MKKVRYCTFPEHDETLVESRTKLKEILPTKSDVKTKCNASYDHIFMYDGNMLHEDNQYNRYW